MALLEIQWNPDRRQLRSFGLIAAVMCLLLGACARAGYVLAWPVPVETAARAATTFWMAALACGTLAVVRPPMLRPLYLLLTLAGFPIGVVVGHLILAFVYYGVLTPIAVVFRVAGRDALKRTLDRTAGSYWIPRQSAGDARRYYRQF
jgi:hypothetical protein